MLNNGYYIYFSIHLCMKLTRFYCWQDYDCVAECLDANGYFFTFPFNASLYETDYIYCWQDYNYVAECAATGRTMTMLRNVRLRMATLFAFWFISAWNWLDFIAGRTMTLLRNAGLWMATFLRFHSMLFNMKLTIFIPGRTMTNLRNVRLRMATIFAFWFISAWNSLDSLLAGLWLCCGMSGSEWLLCGRSPVRQILWMQTGRGEKFFL